VIGADLARFGGMRYLGVVWGVLLAVGVGGVREAKACGQIAEPLNYFTFAEPLPARGSEGAFLDAPIILRGHAWSIGGSPVVLSWFEVQSVTLTDSDGNNVAVNGGTEAWSQEFGTSIWRHAAPLAPKTEYTVSAVLAPQDQPRPPDATSSESIEFTFTTGGESAPPLALDGELAVRLEQAELPVTTCGTQNDCGEQDCQQTGTRAALLAHVTVPAVHGGIDGEHYDGLVMFTDDSPAQFAGPGGDVSTDAHTVTLAEGVKSHTGTASEVVFEVVDEERAYSPCFSYNAWDVRGQNVVAEAVCLEALRPGDVLAKSDPPSPDAVEDTVPAEATPRADAKPQPQGTAEPRATSAGCSLSAPQAPSQGGLLAFAALGALFAVRFRQRN
jgi:MYXO-CTERM domain-containing protein